MRLSVVLLLVMLSCFSYAQTRDVVRNMPIDLEQKHLGKVSDFGSYHALLIYVEEYDILRDLKTPKNDVENIAEILTNRYGFESKNVKILRNPGNGDDLIEAFSEFSKTLQKSDNLLIYYAGHGSKNGFWQLSEARKDIEIGWISISFIINMKLKQMRAKHILVVSDSCYSGVLTRDGVKIDDLSPTDKNFYTKLNSYKSRTALSSGADTPVLDDDGNGGVSKHSVFANGFIQMLQDNKKSIFSLEDRWAKVKRYVMVNTPENLHQIPQYGDIRNTGHRDGGDFIFIDHKVLAQQSQVTTPTVNPELILKPEIEVPIVVPYEEEKKYSLTIKPIPSNAKIYIMKVADSYSDGVRLKKGDYTIKAVAEGYKKRLVDISLYKNSSYNIVLEKIEKKVIPEKPKVSSSKNIVTIDNLMYQNQPFTKEYTWSKAKNYCRDLSLGGYDNWRLPNRSELKKLLTKNKSKNSKGEGHYIRKEFLENMPKYSWFWTSTTHKDASSNAWYVYFSGGFDYWSNKSGNNYALCVR